MTSDIISPDEIHRAVGDRYGRIAGTFEPGAAGSCCGPDDDCGCASGLYDAALLDGLPADVTGLSLGCGDPVTLASLRPGQAVLDLGSGGGIDAFIAARQVGPQGRVLGVDMTPAMLDKANANKAKLGADNVEFRQGFIEHLPVEDASIDVVISNCVINLSPDKPQVFREAYRVLRPGGRLAVSDIVLEGQFSPQARANMDSWSACVAGALPVEEYTHAIRAAGFVDVEVEDKRLTPDEVLDQPAPGQPRIFSARVVARKPQ